MTKQQYTIVGMSAAGASIGIGIITYALSIVSVPSFTLSLPVMMAPMSILGVAAVALLIKEMK